MVKAVFRFIVVQTKLATVQTRQSNLRTDIFTCKNLSGPVSTSMCQSTDVDFHEDFCIDYYYYSS